MSGGGSDSYARLVKYYLVEYPEDGGNDRRSIMWAKILAALEEG
jgi:hypothetical protein